MIDAKTARTDALKQLQIRNAMLLKSFLLETENKIKEAISNGKCNVSARDSYNEDVINAAILELKKFGYKVKKTKNASTDYREYLDISW